MNLKKWISKINTKIKYPRNSNLPKSFSECKMIDQLLPSPSAAMDLRFLVFVVGVGCHSVKSGTRMTGRS